MNFNLIWGYIILKNKEIPFWTSINKVPRTYPWLSQNQEASVCVIGGGITGALCALKFAEHGVNTVLLSADPIGYGSTARDSGVMQLNVGGGLCELGGKIGVDSAINVYKCCLDALVEIEETINSCDHDCGFYKTNTLSFTQKEDFIYDLRQEYLMLKYNGFDVDLIDRTYAENRLNFNVELGLVGNNFGAVVDPYLFTHMTIESAERVGARIYENTVVKNIFTDGKRPIIETATNHKIICDKVIIATGMECCEFLKSCGIRKTAFSIATVPIDNFSEESDRWIINKIDNPEVMYSVTNKNNIIATGLSVGSVDKNGKIAGVLPLSVIRNKKYEQLESNVKETFPSLKNTTNYFTFTSNYIETADGLPIIGEHKKYNNCYFAFCGMQNGVLFSQIASKLLLDLYCENQNNLENVFSPEK